MTKLFSSILIILLCVALVFNFVRVTVSGEFFEYDPSVVRTMSYYAIAQDFSAISEDTEVLFRNMSYLTTSCLDLLSEVYDQLLLLLSFQDRGSPLEVIRDILLLPVKTLVSLGKVLGSLVLGLFDVGQFAVSVLRDVIAILNHLLGFNLPMPDTVPGIGEGTSGGGFGGRR